LGLIAVPTAFLWAIGIGFGHHVAHYRLFPNGTCSIIHSINTGIMRFCMSPQR
jgi:hypothetical protein